MTPKCPKPTCRALTVERIDALGRVAFDCPACARKRQRLCRDCPARTASTRHIRCDRCAKARHRDLERARDRARYAKRRAAVLAHHRRRCADPVIREHRRQYMAQYHLRNPRDNHDRAYMRAYMRQRRADPTYRARELEAKRLARKADGGPHVTR